MSAILLSAAAAVRRCTAGCPSGQRERSVKPSAQPTLVRTQHLPPPAKTARWLRILAAGGPFFSVPACVTLYRCRPSCFGVHGRIADGRPCCQDGWCGQLGRSVRHVRTVGVHRRRFHGRARTGCASGVFRLDVLGLVGFAGASATALTACCPSATRARRRVPVPPGNTEPGVIRHPAVLVAVPRRTGAVWPCRRPAAPAVARRRRAACGSARAALASPRTCWRARIRRAR